VILYLPAEELCKTRITVDLVTGVKTAAAIQDMINVRRVKNWKGQYRIQVQEDSLTVHVWWICIQQHSRRDERTLRFMRYFLVLCDGHEMGEVKAIVQADGIVLS
jgi:hypothetical protein